VIELGRLGLGTAPLADPSDAAGDSSACEIVDAAWELGVRFFDTAPLYGSGLAERRLGAALRGRPRDAFVVSTKVGRLLRPDGRAYFDFSFDAARRSLAGSLERLGLDRIDVALVHDPDHHYDEALAGALRALTSLRDEGVVRAIGIGMNQAQLLCRFVREADTDCVLIAGRYTLLDRTAANELLPLCTERGVAVVAAGVFNSGILAGGTTFDYTAAPASVVARVAELHGACRAHGVPLGAAAVQFPLRHPAIASILVGCSSADEVAEDMRLATLDVPPQLWRDLARSSGN
jgi:D-threo-aldose 1-dehydrogenase